MWKITFTVLCLAYVTSAEMKKAIAVLRNPTNGVDGTVTFEETMDGILVRGNITGLKPGQHGFHIHENGDVSDPKCASAGGHFNPFNKTHGGRDDKIRHVGDLGNIDAVENITSTFVFTDKQISMKGDTNILGKCLVVHANRDDLGRSQETDSLTTGHSGPALAWGEIKSAAVQHQTSMFLSFMLLLLVFVARQ